MLKRVLLVVVIGVSAAAHAANWPEHPQLRAVRVSKPPVIDGSLDDHAWQAAPEFTNFTQHDPNDGQPASLATSVRIVYDDNAIYFGAKMTDPQRPTALLVRRDTFGQFDFLSINIDPQLDRLSGNAFTVTPSNVQVDSVLYNDIGEDGSWDGVWDSATRVVPDGWIAEIRIPFSQLRFPDKPVHVWGINITRHTVRNNETSRIVNTRKGQTGFVSHFADITGIEGIHRGKPLELVPYSVARSDVRTRADRTDPFLDRRDARAEAGLDLKYALTSSLTLTGTINPDFGQVEVDPAVVNLSQFETFYPEKRPFFTEGLNIFRFGDSPAPAHFNFVFPPSLFYTRRIGRAPQGVPDDADYVAAPTETRILGAAKITGKLAGGWSVGVLDALTSSDYARIATAGEFSRQQVEPLTNYFVSRVTREIGDGARVGFMLNSVARRLPSELTPLLRRDALTGGVDGYYSFAKKNWIAEGFLVGSRVSGSADAIASTQESSARYYQRPDAQHVSFDPTRTSLDGWGGRAMVSKATGIWRPIFSVQAYSPGFETNDIGFMQRTDVVSSQAVMVYSDQDPTTHFRERNAWMGVWLNQNFDGDTFERGAFVDHYATLSNYWTYRASLFVTPGSFNDRLTRGGPVVRTATSWASDTSIGSDARKPFAFSVNGHWEGGRDHSYARVLGVTLTARPSPNLTISASPTYSRSLDANGYVDAYGNPAATGTYGTSYRFANLHQHSFDLGTRVDWTLSPRLSFQLYTQPFIATGDYRGFHTLAAARTRDYLPALSPAAADNPDFDFRSVRGSAVARWEFRPGSALYIVWNENRAESETIGTFRFGRDLRRIPNAPSHDVFLIKLSYWLPM